MTYTSSARLFAAATAIGLFASLPAVAAPAATPAAAPPAAAPAAASAAAAAAPAADPVVAKVGDVEIHMSEVALAEKSLPAQARQMDPAKLYPLIVNQLIDAQALLIEARKTGVDKDPEVQQEMKMAQERMLESAVLNKLVMPQVSEDALKAKYTQEYANKPGEPEVHARHILVADEATAKKIIAELKKGGDFAALSKKYSKDPGAAQQGGDLGFFKKSDMVPEFADAAFALKDKEITPVPVKTQFGYHVIQTLEHRMSKPPTFEEVHDELRQQVGQAAVHKAIAEARNSVTVERFNPDGSPMKATDTAMPPAK